MSTRCALRHVGKAVRLHVTVAGLVLVMAFPTLAFQGMEEGSTIPGFALTTTTGQRVEVSGGGEQAVVIAFVRQGQDNSVSAMGDLQKTAEKFGDKIVVLAVVTNPAEGDAAAWVSQTGASFPVLLDDAGEVYGKYGVRVMPATGVVKPDGTLAGTVSGYTRGYDGEIARLVDTALGLATAAAAEQGAADPTELKSEGRKKAERSVEKARLLAKRKMEDKALAAAEEAVAADGEYLEGRVFLGDMLLAASEENADTARVHYEKALALDPKSVDAKVGVARVASIQGDSERAVELLTAAASLNPKPEKVYFELGKVYERAGNYQKAVEAYRMALERLLR